MADIYFIPLEEAHAVFKDKVGIAASEWRCGCGCEGVTLWARDQRALWIAPTQSPVPATPFIVTGFETLAEVGAFIERMRTVARRAGETTVYIDELGELLVEQFSD